MTLEELKDPKNFPVYPTQVHIKVPDLTGEGKVSSKIHITGISLRLEVAKTVAAGFTSNINIAHIGDDDPAKEALLNRIADWSVKLADKIIERTGQN